MKIFSTYPVFIILLLACFFSPLDVQHSQASPISCYGQMGWPVCEECGTPPQGLQLEVLPNKTDEDGSLSLLAYRYGAFGVLGYQVDVELEIEGNDILVNLSSHLPDPEGLHFQAQNNLYQVIELQDLKPDTYFIRAFWNGETAQTIATVVPEPCSCALVAVGCFFFSGLGRSGKRTA